MPNVGTSSFCSPKKLLPAGLVFFICGLVALLHAFPLPLPADTILWRQFSDFGHIPLFGFLGLLFLRLSIKYVAYPGLKREHHYGLALFGAIAVGLGGEILQSFGPRHADIKDFFRDIIGAGCGLLLVATYDSVLLREKPLNHKGWRIGTRLISILFVVICFIPVGLWLEAYRQQASQVPILHRFETPWERFFLRTQHATLTFVSSPPRSKFPQNNRVAQLTFHKARYPGLTFLEPYPDWTPYRALTFTVFSDLSHPTDLHLRIQDIHHTNDYSDRFNTSLRIHPGMNFIRIPLEKVQSAPAQRAMDMQAISKMVIFVTRPAHSFALYFDDFILQQDEATLNTSVQG